MPFNPAQFAYQPRPLQQYDFGSGFRDIIEARQGRERADAAKAQLAEQTAGRQDLNTRFSAEQAGAQSIDARTEAMKKYQQAVKLADDARKAGNTGDWNTAEALGPRLLEMGGEYTKEMGSNGYPVYHFKAPGEPTLPQPDYQGTKQAIFGGGGQQPQPFEMKSPFGPGGSMFTERNPFDSLPGQSSQSLPNTPPPQPGDPAYIAAPPPDAAGQPPGAAGDGPQRPMDTAPTQPPPAPPQAQAGPPPGPAQDNQQLPPNPFDPFKIDTAQVGAQNQLRMQPFFEGAEGSIPGRFRDRLQNLNAGAQALNLPPDDTLKLWQPAYATAAGLMKSELGAEAASARTALGAENAELGRNIRLENRTFSRADKIAQNTGLKDAISKLQVAEGADKYAEAALHGDGQAATQLTAQLFRMNQSGVMTDKDFEHASQGAVTVWQAIKNGTINHLFKNGISLDQYRDIKEVLGIARSNHVKSVMDAQRQLWTQVVRAGSDEERKSAEDAIMQLIPQPYWTPEVQEAFGMEVPQKSGNVDQAGNYAAGGRGGGSSKASASASVKTKRLIDGDVSKLKDEDIGKALDEVEEELRKGKR